MTQVIRGSAVPSFIINANHIITHWNHACEILTGVSEDDIVGTNQQWRAFYKTPRPLLADLILDNVSENVISEYYQRNRKKSDLVAGGYEVCEHFPNLGGVDKWLFFTAGPIKDESGRTVAVMETLQDTTGRVQAEEQLKNEQEALRRKNIALKEVLSQIESEKKDIASQIQRNIERAITPLLKKLEEKSPPSCGSYYILLRKSLLEITSPFLNQLESLFNNLTSREEQICGLVKSGMSSKEIALMFNTAETTIRKHRRNIRKKLGIACEKTNLSSFLRSLQTR